MPVRRIFVEKKPGFDVEAHQLLKELQENLLLSGLKSVRILQRYDTEGIPEREFEKTKTLVFSEPPVDNVYDEEMPVSPDETIIAVTYLPGQYDQRADSAAQCVQLITLAERPDIQVARMIVLKGDLSEADIAAVRQFVINPVETHEAPLSKPNTLHVDYPVPEMVSTVEGFIDMAAADLQKYMHEMGFAMSDEDLAFCQAHYRDDERRNPTVTELRMIDTYWSDHCRHTTFLTEIDQVTFDDGPTAMQVKAAYEQYLGTRKQVYGEREKAECLMDVATLAMKSLRKSGKLNNLDESDEINACSIVVPADVDGKTEDWLVMFKNETHNHPTEIEPFGGAATCLGGAIRDPLSGRSYVYQAMRVTGAADPRKPFSETLPGKLPQRVITTTAAHGYSSYGNQIGLATGMVAEVYHDDYVAKRMEIGAVVGAAPKTNVIRKVPETGDIIILLGGRTGRDGCGGATGSSKEHTEESLATCGAEVQKGNPPTERKIQRLFRKQQVTRMIKRCNDFGAGGISVAIGELADGLDINLDAVPKKYEGLDGTELAISESQERMAVVVSPMHADEFIREARIENLEATKVAVVTNDRRLRMNWRGKRIVDISRDFLDTNGVKQHVSIHVTEPAKAPELGISAKLAELPLSEAWENNLKQLNVCSQKGLVERFDSTIGAASVLMPFGGETQLTPADAMVAKLPVESGNTITGTVMAHGFNPDISKASPFHGAVLAVVESMARLVACGGNPKDARLTLQEYFEKLGKDPQKWGKPLSALLGAFWAQMSLGVAAIGGKDSMSGTFKDISVPPTLVSFAIAPLDVRKTVSQELKNPGNRILLFKPSKTALGLPDFQSLQSLWQQVYQLIQSGVINAASAVKYGGVAETVSKMTFGNHIGLVLNTEIKVADWFAPEYGALVVAISDPVLHIPASDNFDIISLGETQCNPEIRIGDLVMPIAHLSSIWQAPLEHVFPTQSGRAPEPVKAVNYTAGVGRRRTGATIVRPKVFIPVFPGSNCEYDSKRAFEAAGAQAEVFVLKNLTAKDVDESVHAMQKMIAQSQIIMLPGGFSAGDEPEGSGKFIATVFRNPYLMEAVTDLLQKRDGLMLGICNGFQALVKLGLLPYGEIRDLTPNCPTLTFNEIGRHISLLVQTRVASNLSPWLAKEQVGDIHTIAMSHGEGRFVASPEVLAELEANGQIATQYVDLDRNPTMDIRYNPNGSMMAIEGISSADGRVFGKMGHTERYSRHTFRNVPGDMDQRLFEGGVCYYS